MRKCPICGKSDIPDDIQFCPNPDCLWELVMWLGATEQKRVEVAKLNYRYRAAQEIAKGAGAEAVGKKADTQKQVKADNAEKQSEYSAETKLPKSDLSIFEYEKEFAEHINSYYSSDKDFAMQKAEQEADAGNASQDPKQGTVWKEPVTGMEFIYVPGGEFEMGDQFGDGSDDEKPIHTVELDGFWIGKYPVTQGEWEQVMRCNPAKFNKGDHYPIERVSWNNVQDFNRKLLSLNNHKYQFALPSEAQWEYAARSGGRKEKYAGGSDVHKLAWHKDNSNRSTHPVGTKAPNGLGIYDMSGNVMEWCQDVFDSKAYLRHSGKNPVITSGGSERVQRGGCFFADPRYVRAAYRNHATPDFRLSLLGFRLALPKVLQE